MGVVERLTWDIPNENEAATMYVIAQAARGILTFDSCWTKYQLARDQHNRVCNIYSEDAYQFDIVGAIQRAVYKLHMDKSPYEALKRFYEVLCWRRNAMPLRVFNDQPTTTHNMIVDFMDSGVVILKAFAHV